MLRDAWRRAEISPGDGDSALFIVVAIYNYMVALATIAETTI
jgi:hypothetical protein